MVGKEQKEDSKRSDEQGGRRMSPRKEELQSIADQAKNLLRGDEKWQATRSGDSWLKDAQEVEQDVSIPPREES